MIHANTTAWRRATLALCLGSMLVFINLYAPQPLLPLLRDGTLSLGRREGAGGTPALGFRLQDA